MVINEERCVGCGLCLNYCPAHAISIHEKKAVIDLDLCFECGNCKYANVCKTDAFVQQTMTWPRVIRSIFSNVRIISPNTNLSGRGTEEMKTNDVTGRFKPGTIGIACEMGRPGTGTTFKDVETIAKVVVHHGGKLEEKNPTFFVFDDPNKGTIKKEYLNERALSVIIEALVDKENLVPLLENLKDAQDMINTVFSLDVISVMEDEKIFTNSLIEKAGLTARPNGKTCVGLGRPRKEF